MNFVKKIQIVFASIGMSNLTLKVACITVLFLMVHLVGFNQSITTSPITGTYCDGATVTVPYSVSGVFTAGNVFTAQLSDGTGSFASPVNIGTHAGTTSSSITGIIPTNAAAGVGYRIRVVSSTPVIIGSDNSFDLTVSVPTLSPPAFVSTSFCQGDVFNITATTSCNFFNTPSNNVFTAQLSDATGSFASPVSIGTRTATTGGTISATIPAGTPAGNAYRIRLVSSNPAITTADNGTNLTVSAIAGTPSVFGNGFWNVYAYNGSAFNTYFGYYTENNLNFNTQTRWGSAVSPSSADNSTGLAYQGCPIPVDNHSYTYKRTNFTCGYYQIDIPTHDDDVTLLINGTQVFIHNGCCDAHTNVWTGFLGASSTVEVKLQEGGGSSYLSIQFSAAPNPITLSDPATICSGTPTTLTATAAVPLTYSWTPTATLNTPNGPSVIATPTTTTTYTATGTDATTTCQLTKSVLITVAASPSTTVSGTLATICSGVVTSTLTATGANSYSWTPSAGLSATTGSTVVANPATTTTYTVTGNNNCSSNTATKTIVVENIPPAPSSTTFGNGVWNVFVHNATTLTNYYGYYTENNLNFNTTTRWTSSNPPSTANASTGSAYSGCTVPNTNYAMSFKRTGIPCGYYQIDIPNHDDNITLLINGTQVFQHNGCCDAHTNAWSGFISPTSTVEFQLINFTGPGLLQATFTLSSPLVLSPPVIICQTTSTTLTATSSITGATYAWTPNDGSLATPNSATSQASPNTTTTYTSTITDAAGTNCTASSKVLVTVNPVPSTAVTPTTATITCPTSAVTLTATGANTYSWSPGTGLSATSGYTVTALPTTTTTYTVTGSNNCSSNTATSTITVIPLPATTIYPSNTWNVYCYNTTTLSGYQGYYTDNGSGTGGYDINTATRWVSGTAPSTANNTNGTAYVGCTMPATNFSLSFKRTNFNCGLYQVNILSHDDQFNLNINGVTVASHNGAGDSHVAVWTGVLNSNSQVEFQLIQGGGGSVLNVQIVPLTIPASQSTWVGGVSSDWFAASNWCGGGGVPTASTDVVIPAAGPQFMPTISASGAVCKNLTINSAIASGTYTTAIAAPILTVNGTFDLAVNGNWSNSGTFTPGTGSVTFTGSGVSNTIVASAIENFYDVIINKTNGITITSGIHQVANNITFTNGVLTQNGTLSVLNGGTVTGASNASYVNGSIRKVGNTAFTFPVGAANVYRPITITAPTLTTDHFTAQYFNSSTQPTYPNSQRDLTMDHVSKLEYWILNRTNGTSNVSVTLNWNAASNVGYLPDLRVARWDATLLKWKDQGNGGTTGNTTAGTIITSGAVTSFSPFTFGTTSIGNPLPIELTDFVCKGANGLIDLLWSTSSERDNDYFTVERASDNIQFEEIGTVKAVGNSSINQSYSLRDSATLNGTTYYRLKQTDIDGKTKILKVCSIEVASESDEDVVVYPNPANNFVYVKLNGNVPLHINIISIMGEYYSQPLVVDNDKVVLNASSLTSGMYVIQVVTAQKVMQHKIAIEQ